MFFNTFLNRSESLSSIMVTLCIDSEPINFPAIVQALIVYQRHILMCFCCCCFIVIRNLECLTNSIAYFYFQFRMTIPYKHVVYIHKHALESYQCEIFSTIYFVFLYKREANYISVWFDVCCQQDEINWVLLEKSSNKFNAKFL